MNNIRITAMKTIFWGVAAFCFLSVNIAAQSDITITNPKGEAVYIAFNKNTSITSFLNDNANTTIEKFAKLEAISISNIEMTPSFKRIKPRFQQFLQSVGKSVKHLHVYDSEFECEDFRQILAAMDSSRLETLIWENMEDLDDEDEINAVIQNSGHLFVSLRKLSLKGTIIGEDGLFLTKLTFDSLRELNLSGAIDDTDVYRGILNNLQHFPKLAYLNIDYPDISAKTINDTVYIPEGLNTVSLRLSDENSKTYAKYLNRIKPLLAAVTRIEVQPRFRKLEYQMPNNGWFEIENNIVKNTLNKGDLGGIKRLTRLQVFFPGIFRKLIDSDRVDLKPDAYQGPFFLSEISAINRHLENYLAEGYQNLVLIGAEIDEALLKNIHVQLTTGKNHQLKRIFLGNTYLTTDQLDELRESYFASGLTIHVVTGVTLQQPSYFDTPWMHHDRHQQMFDNQMRNMQKQMESIKIPRMR
jgi:hypothetical protein